MLTTATGMATGRTPLGVRDLGRLVDLGKPIEPATSGGDLVPPRPTTPGIEPGPRRQ